MTQNRRGNREGVTERGEKKKTGGFFGLAQNSYTLESH
jgi:hypothetical protein